MKTMKKMLALVTTLAMVLTMVAATGLTAFAADDGSIKIQNTVKDSTYNVYKVFDATYSGKNVAYSYDGSNATFLAALQADDSPFNCVAATSGGYSITVKENVQDSQILDFIKGQVGNFGAAVATLTGNGETQTVNDLAYGYYFITTTTGTLVTIDNALKDVTVIDKNEVIPPPDKAEKVANGTWVGEKTNETAETTGNVGDTVNYKVTGSFKRYQGEDVVTKITFTDTMTAGLTPNKDVVIKINGETVSVTPTYSNNDRTWTAEITTATINATDGTITFNYPTPSTYEITYSAVINEDAVVANPDSNTFTLKYNDKPGGNDTTEVVSYQITLEKVDKDKTKLAGAKFKLYDAKTEGNEIPVVLVTSNNDPAGYGTKDSTVDNVYRHAKTGETGVEMVTGKTGNIIVQGLANGTYYFEETEAPEGFNKLTERTDATTISNANATIEVENNAGTELPSTGGIGTTIFYVLGSLLVVGCGIVLVSRKRMQNNK